MREIKFRGKQIVNGAWVYGNLLTNGKEAIIANYVVGIGVCGECASPSDEFDDVIPKTVGQYTGLKDKNGMEIYEGDILKDTHGWIYEVRWDIENGRFLGYHDKPRGDTYICYVGREPAATKIGNIHDSPELVEHK